MQRRPGSSEPSSSSYPAASSSLAPQAHEWLARPPLIIGLILAYLVTHFILRLNFSPTLGIDDAEQALFAQHWAQGYRFRQPPLFTWLLLPITDMVGPGVLAISIVRYSLLALTYICLYLTALSWIDDRRLAGLSVLSFSLIYVFAYYAHHDLTHTTALGAMIAASLLAFTRLSQQPTTPRYLLLGLCFGLGMLAKWNFVMLAIGLPLTCLLFAGYRHLVLDKRCLLAVLVMALIITPTALWMFSHGQSTGRVSNDILSVSSDIDGLALWIEGGTALLSSTLLFPMPFLLIFVGVFGASFLSARSHPVHDPLFSTRHRFLLCLISVVLGLHVLLIPLFGAVTFTERWMHPALMILPLVLFALVQPYEINYRLISVYLTTICILVAVVAGARLYRFVEGAAQCGKCREFAPFVELSSSLRKAGFDRGTIVADGMHIGGNLKVAFPESRVVDPAFPLALWPSVAKGRDDRQGMCLLVWRSDSTNVDARREAVRQFAHGELGLPVTAVREQGYAKAALYQSEHRHYALGFELIRENSGGCR